MAEQRFASLPLNGSLKDRLTADLFHSVIRLTQGALFLLQPLSVSSRILARPSRRGPGIRKFDKWTAGSISSFAPGIVAAMSSLCSGRATVSYWPRSREPGSGLRRSLRPAPTRRRVLTDTIETDIALWHRTFVSVSPSPDSPFFKLIDGVAEFAKPGVFAGFAPAFIYRFSTSLPQAF